jgi:hypothetical protein
VDDYDQKQLSVLKELEKALRGLPGLKAIDVDLNAGVCVITASDQAAEKLAKKVAVSIDQQRVELTTILQDGPEAQLLFTVEGPLPIPPSGQVCGGDAIWDPAIRGWGTLAFSSLIVQMLDSTGTPIGPVNNAILSCNHVLARMDAALIGDQLATYAEPSSITLAGFLPITNLAVPPIDVAIGQTGAIAHTIPHEVRGLGSIQNVAIATSGLRLFKNGARTGITTAHDVGWGLVTVAAYGNRSVILRQTEPWFSDMGDSGSAVLDRYRNLVGIVTMGRVVNGVPITYYLPTAPIGATPLDPTVFVNISI